MSSTVAESQRTITMEIFLNPTNPTIQIQVVQANNLVIHGDSLERCWCALF